MSDRDAIAVLQQEVEAGRLPGAVVAAGTGDDVDLLHAVGWAEVDESAGNRPMTTGTLFDLASLTKVTVTLPLVLRLIEAGELSLDTPVVDVLPEFATPREVAGSDPSLTTLRRDVTVQHLLTHSSGLPASRQFYELGLDPAGTRAMFLTEPLEAAPGTRVSYSDLGFVTLGVLAERIGRARLDALFERYVGKPLGMNDTGYGPRAGDVASTERDASGRAKTGIVHDENCEQLGGIAGHAGLFATAADMGRYAAAWTAGAPDWLSAGILEQAVTDQTPDLDGHRGLGWTCRGDAFDQLGPDWPAGGVFHSGFTGTSLALDRRSARWVVLLTNDVQFGRGRGLINPLRHRVHSALAPE